MAYNVPQYSPYRGTRDEFTTPVVTGQRYDYDADIYYPTRSGGVFDSKGYEDARYGNITDYLSKLGPFMSQYTRDWDADRLMAMNAYKASLPQMPTMQPMQQSTYTGGGWGQASPTWQMGNMTQRQQAPAGILGTTNRGMYGGILGGQQGV